MKNEDRIEARLDREENRVLARERSRRSRVSCPHCGAHVGGKAPAPCSHCERMSRKGFDEPDWYDAAMIATSILRDVKTGMHTNSTFADVFCFAVEEFEAGASQLIASQEGVRLAQIEFEKLCKECAEKYPPDEEEEEVDKEEEEVDEDVQRYLAEEDKIAWESMRIETERALNDHSGKFLRLIAVALRAGADVEPVKGLRQRDDETFMEFMDRFHEAGTNAVFRAAITAAMAATA